MKIAIPTENGVTISPLLTTVTSFLVLTTQFGEILDEEIMHNHRKETGSELFAPGNTLSECDAILVHEIDDACRDSFRELNKEIFETKETIITKAIIDFLQRVQRKATDTCCQP
jgi:hypothetical protein